ncbi:MAG: hypothetical protein ACQEUT_03530 [Bacillota bacterium]
MKKRKKRLFSILAILSLFLVTTFLAGCRLDTGVEENKKVGNPEAITLEEFNQIEKGMSYEEVVSIIGAEGVQMGDGDGNNQVYVWDGEITDSFASVSFLQDKMTRKTQRGIK